MQQAITAATNAYLNWHQLWLAQHLRKVTFLRVDQAGMWKHLTQSCCAAVLRRRKREEQHVEVAANANV